MNIAGIEEHLVRYLTVTGLDHVASAMRRDDVEEFEAYYGKRGIESLKRILLALMSEGRDCMPGIFQEFARKSGTWPDQVAVWGVQTLSPGVGQGFFFATEDWRHVACSASRWMKEVAIPELARRYHRVQVDMLATRADSRRWLEWLGAREEAVLRDRGGPGVDFVTMVWRRSDMAASKEAV